MSVLKNNMYSERTLTSFLLKSSKSFPIVLIVGPRQVGKTTLLKHAEQSKRDYVTFDDPLARSLAKQDPALFLQNLKRPLLIDEIQYVPELLPLIKMEVDKNQKAGDFWLTGSQQFHLMHNISESLAGRVAILNLQGLSQHEKRGIFQAEPFLPTQEPSLDRYCELVNIFEIIFRGSFPKVALDKDIDHDLFYSSYVQTYLERDIRDLARVSDEQAFIKFLRAVAARTATVINFSDLARDIGIAPTTAKAWLSLLETSGIIYFLEPFYINETKRLIKSAKLYFLDTGLCSYLAGWTNAQTLERGAFSGLIFETYVMSELLKSYWHNGKRAPFFFYRDKDKKEIDLVIYQDGTLYPVEIKKTASPSQDDAKHFYILKQFKIPVSKGTIICLAQDYYFLTADVSIFPLKFL
jgi:uncharacterized protein